MIRVMNEFFTYFIVPDEVAESSLFFRLKAQSAELSEVAPLYPWSLSIFSIPAQRLFLSGQA